MKKLKLSRYNILIITPLLKIWFKKKLDQRINLRRHRHKKQQLTLNGNIAMREDVREYGHQYLKNTATQEIETVQIYSHNINNIP